MFHATEKTSNSFYFFVSYIVLNYFMLVHFGLVNIYLNLWTAVYPFQTRIWNPQPLVPQNGTVFGDQVFKKVAKLKWDP